MKIKPYIETVLRNLHEEHVTQIGPTSFISGFLTPNEFTTSNRLVHEEDTFSEMIGISTPVTFEKDDTDTPPKIHVVLKETTIKTTSSFQTPPTYAGVIAGLGNIGYVDKVQEPVYQFFQSLEKVLLRDYREVIDSSLEVQTTVVEQKGLATDYLTIVEIYYGPTKSPVVRVAMPTALLISYIYF